MSYSLGTKSWIARNNGKLGLRDRFTMIYQGVKAKVILAQELNSGVKLASMSIDEILPPDTQICLEAMQISQQASEPFLFNHCLRAYFWARLLNDGHAFDNEATFTAIMLHDLGLTKHYCNKSKTQECFTVPAARVAEKLAAKYDWSDNRSNVVSNAITLHLNITIDNNVL